MGYKVSFEEANKIFDSAPGMSMRSGHRKDL